ncbi:hypothetical protein IMZ48_33630 [Candidatus Bathyarchaeota archaeon]|nr:hypothetical protein [Candidatus Bathyarchaeota archaeon]
MPTPSTEWPATDQRHLRISLKKRRRRRRSGQSDKKTTFGSFKLPEEPTRLPGFKKPRRPTSPGTPPSPEAPIYLCKDGFDERESIPEGKSVFVPRNRHREISGLGPLSFGKPAPAASRKVAQSSSPASARSHVSATSGSSGEVGFFGPGGGCGFLEEIPEAVALGDATASPNGRVEDGVQSTRMERGPLERLEEVEPKAKRVLVRQTPEPTGCDLRTPCAPENPSIPETPARKRTFYASSPSDATEEEYGVYADPPASHTNGGAADNTIRRNTTRGQRDSRPRQAADPVFIPRNQLRRAVSAGFSGGRSHSPELY